jgi:para-nitrobenzyl esterase
LQELRALPPNRIAEAVSKKQGGFPVTVDGRLLVEPVEDTYAAGRQAQVPLLAGWNRDEYTALANGMTVEKWKAYAAEHFQERAAEFLKLFPGDTDEQAIRSAIDLNGDQFIAFSTWKWIEAQSKTANAPVYGYHFELPALPSKYHLGSYAFHSDDIEYVFGTLDTRPGETVRADDRKLSELMMSYWTNFAKTGDPNAPGLPAWPRFDKYRQILHLDSSVKATQDTLRPRYEFLLKGIPPYNF